MFPAFANWSMVMQEIPLFLKVKKKRSHSCLTAVLAKLAFLSNFHEEEATVGNSNDRQDKRLCLDIFFLKQELTGTPKSFSFSPGKRNNWHRRNKGIILS